VKRSNVEVYTAWIPAHEPRLAGQLTFAETSRGGVFSFAYNNAFLESDDRLQIDPLLILHTGETYEVDTKFIASSSLPQTL